MVVKVGLFEEAGDLKSIGGDRGMSYSSAVWWWSSYSRVGGNQEQVNRGWGVCAIRVKCRVPARCAGDSFIWRMVSFQETERPAISFRKDGAKPSKSQHIRYEVSSDYTCVICEIDIGCQDEQITDKFIFVSMNIRGPAISPNVETHFGYPTSGSKLCRKTNHQPPVQSPANDVLLIDYNAVEI
ncbi:hypothetical protein LXL04_003883 [Taraxacum kok-saghyz]